jgi:hypothetical protein
MFSYNPSDAVACFENAHHLNAAMKKIMKSDASKDPKTARYTKALRNTLKSPKSDALAAFVEKAIPDYEDHLLLTVRNSYAPLIEPILDGIIERHAEAFNDTYTVDSNTGAVTVTEEAAFKEIGFAALKELESEVEKADMPNNAFMKSVVANSLFDRAVLEELTNLASESR